MPSRQDQEPAVIGDQVQAVVWVAETPTHPALPHRAFPGGGGKAQQRDPFLAPGCHVPEGFTDFRQHAQILMPLPQGLITRCFTGPNRAHVEFFHVHSGGLAEVVNRLLLYRLCGDRSRLRTQTLPGLAFRVRTHSPWDLRSKVVTHPAIGGTIKGTAITCQI